jgi:hypothetical protein
MHTSKHHKHVVAEPTGMFVRDSNELVVYTSCQLSV